MRHGAQAVGIDRAHEDVAPARLAQEGGGVRGVMQSYAVARAMAALVATGRFEEVDLAPLARDRFDDPARWVTEDLHI